ncbi:MAG: DMT family transporter [Actinomycetota bacterium]|nr:DMT family transporter [Actinomycetota bacterium]
MRRDRGTRRGLGAVTGAAILLGTTGTAAALGPESLGAEVAAAWRAVIGGVVLVALAAAVGQPVWRYPASWPWAALGAVGVAVNQLGFFAAVDRAGVATGTLVTVGAVPVAAGVIDAATGRRPHVTWAAGVAGALGGVALLTGWNDDPAWGGVGLAAVAGVAAAGFGFAAQRLMSDRPALPAMATVVAGGGVLLLPIALGGVGVAFGSWPAATTVGYLGVFTMAGAYALWGAGLGRLPLALVAAVTLAEPAVAALLAALVLDEPVTAASLVGTALVLVGVAITTVGAASVEREGEPRRTVADP